MILKLSLNSQNNFTPGVIEVESLKRSLTELLC